ncbi:hypothetical protein BGZ58_010463 [Dissophora ornata]|nr:hypothetical protein BGZ58_010463 [Dissophora ornata]
MAPPPLAIAASSSPLKFSGADNGGEMGPSSDHASYTQQRHDFDLLPSISLAPLQQQRKHEHEQHRQLSNHSSTFVSALQQILPPNSSPIVSGSHHAIYPAAPSISTIDGGTSSSSGSYSPLDPWQAPTLGGNDFSALYAGASVHHSAGGHQQQGRSSQSVSPQGFPSVHSNKVQVDETVAAMLAEERLKESKRMQKIANDMLAIKKYDLSIRIPRHISQEQDEFFIFSEPYSSTDVADIPGHLQLLPRDANYLADVFFENAYFYYPIINRTVVELCMMEPQTPQALFMLNIVFMTACKHLGRMSDIKRAIQFRERAREVRFYIDTGVRLSRMQAILLGSLVVYGVFKSVLGFTEVCGTYSALSATPSLATNDSFDDAFPDLHVESQSIQAKKCTIPEAAYQVRLWTFWGLYIRDSISRLYFGWPHGLDSMAVTAELPKIEGSVGLGGNRGLPSQMHTKVTGKRRDSPFTRDHNTQSDKRHMAHPEGVTDRANYRSTQPDSDDDDDDDDDPAGQDRDEKLQLGSLQGIDEFRKGGPNNSGRSARGLNMEPFSVLSPKILEQQSRHCHPAHQTDTETNSPVDQQELNLHMERMKLILDAEDDTTDSGSYARVLFLEEIRLWSLGRRVALYLAGRMSITAPSACPTVAPPSSRTKTPSLSSLPSSATAGQESGLFPAADWLASSAHKLAGQWSEQAWTRDQELQILQADLIAWEKALPDHLRFRADVDQSDVNHKVNGKMGLLIMSYYTITIMLQTSYLPIPQCTSPSRSRASSAKPGDRSSSKEAGDAFRKSNTAVAGSPGGLQSTQSAVAAISPADATHSTQQQQQQRRQQQKQFQPSQDHSEYFNTAHQICTELSNVLLHHVELMLDTYPDWCTIQAKINHALTAALRVSCLNAKLSSNSSPARQEAKAGFKMGSDLFKKLALMPYPLTIRDWPVEEDVQLMMEIEEEFKEMMVTQEERQAALSSSGAAAEHLTADGVSMGEAIDAGVAVGEEGEQERTFGVRQQPIFGIAEDDYKFEFYHGSTSQ